jgi:methionine--tRNA ligase beta chain
LPFDLAALKRETSKAFLEYRLSHAADLAVEAGTATNKWITDLAPWNMKEESQKVLRASCCRLLLEAVYVLAHFFGPFIPAGGEAILKKLGVAPTAIPDLSDKFNHLKTGDPVISGTVLYEVFDVQHGAAANSSPAPAVQPAAKAAPKEKAAAKAAPAKEKVAKAAPSDDQPLFSKLDVRVGRVVDAWHHPEADRLFIEKIDVGEAEPRQIVSGLREHYKLEEFKGRKLLAVCNMKPSKLVKVDSFGMVLCAKDMSTGKEKVELLDVPDNLEVGARILPEGVPATFEPFECNAAHKKKIWPSIAELLRTDGSKLAVFDGKPLMGPGGEKIFAPTLPNAVIS